MVGALCLGRRSLGVLPGALRGKVGLASGADLLFQPAIVLRQLRFGAPPLGEHCGQHHAHHGENANERL